MDEYHKPHEKKKVGSGTGGRRGKLSDKRLSQIGGVFSATKVSPKDVRQEKRRRGGSKGIRLKKAGFVNVVTKEGAKKAEIVRVVESHNPEFVRTNIITKGAVLETKLGKVRVTNRVGQDGVVNGVLVS
jgi:small subunit ribosomal protein S8e